jgi:hypothetical protein
MGLFAKATACQNQLSDSDALPSRASCSSWRKNPRFQLPVFDASDEGCRNQDSGVKILKKSRRQKQVVGNGAKTPESKASKTGSSENRIAHVSAKNF